MANLTEIINCPTTHLGLRYLKEEDIESINVRIREGNMRYVDGTIVKEQLKGGLIREDNAVVFRIDEGIPILLSTRGLDLSLNKQALHKKHLF